MSVYEYPRIPFRVETDRVVGSCRMAVSLFGPDGRGAAVHVRVLRACARRRPRLRQTHRAQIIMFSDLECDYINPIDLCNKLNQVSLLSALLGL